MIGLGIKGVSFSYFNGLVLEDVNLTVDAGEMVGLLGPNGSGKTTLLKLACGVLRPKKGEVFIADTRLDLLNRRAIARRIAVVPQQFHLPYAFRVNEVVTLGRIPFLKPLAEESEEDLKIVDSALKMVDISRLQNRRFDELSGGERQKVVLAMTLAQQPEILLLDEPTLHLDINHQVQILELVKQLNISKGITVVAAIHDLNLASLYFDRLILLNGGRIVADGTPAQVITKENIENVFGTSVRVEINSATKTPHIIINPRDNSKS